MSWHYLPALVGESSEHTCSDGEPSAPWKRSRTVERCSFVGRETVCFLCSQSGTTAIPSTEDPGVTAWISSLPDSHASPSAPQERKSIHSTRGTAGQQPFAFLEKCSQGISYWKTSQGCFLDLTGISDRYSETWPRSGMMRSGTAFPLRPSVPRTSEIGSGCLPTPTAVSYGYNQGGAMGRSRDTDRSPEGTPGWDDTRRTADNRSSREPWWGSEPAVGRVADGMAHRLDRLKALGNGQVAPLVRIVWHELRRKAGINGSC